MESSTYVHFPWCLQKCPYCDFASGAIRRDAVAHVQYADAVIRELEARASQVASQRLSSVFFGGGTPSLWDPAQLGRVLAAIRRAYASEAEDLEVTVECNPSSLSQAHAAALREVGVNRLSIGVQSLDDTRLRFLGRLHSADGAIQALTDALAEMPRVSGDLMFGMPGQGPADFLAEAQRLLDLGLDHLSIYALTVEPDTQFGQLHRKGRLKLAPEGDFADTFDATHELMARHGLQHYEVSNYAKAGQSSRHNRHYWQGGSYLGLGAGAVGMMLSDAGAQAAGHDRALGRRYRNAPKPEAYLADPRPETAEVFEEELGAVDLANEAVMLGLRTSDGVDLELVQRRTGLDLASTLRAEAERQRSRGNLKEEGRRWRVPHGRWLHLDAIVASLFQ